MIAAARKRRFGPRGRGWSARTGAGPAFRMERQRDLHGNGLAPGRSTRPSRLGGRAGFAGVGDDPGGESQPARLAGVPGEAELCEPGRGLRRGSAGGPWPRQEVRKRVQIVADADAALRAGLEGGGAAPRERIEHDVAGPRIPRDERVGQGGGKLARYEHIGWNGWPHSRCWSFHSGASAIGGSSSGSSSASCSAAVAPAHDVPTWAVTSSLATPRIPAGAVGRGVIARPNRRPRLSPARPWRRRRGDPGRGRAEPGRIRAFRGGD